mmetsp:Transcript_19277/g.24870  ORF Transcript_19277/g.24870 Transcript_19277/m.24870 type:complete len:234 (-) Transcript_19277:134-835(-)
MKSPMQLNNEAVSLMQRGCFSEAVEYAREAIRSMQLTIKNDGGQSLPISTAREDFSACCPPIRPVVINCVSDKYTDYDCFCMYNRAFVFVTDFDFCSCQSDTACVLFYNLAVVNHISGVTVIPQDAEQFQFLPSALDVYQLALNVMTDEDGNFKIARSNQSAHLGMALLNNMSHLLAFCTRHQDAKSCLDMLEQFWAHQGIDALLFLEEQDADFFLVAVACANLCSLQTAAAA